MIVVVIYKLFYLVLFLNTLFKASNKNCKKNKDIKL